MPGEIGEPLAIVGLSRPLCICRSGVLTISCALRRLILVLALTAPFRVEIQR